MNQELVGSLWTLAGGVALYSIKEVVIYISDTNIQTKKINLKRFILFIMSVIKKQK